MITLAEPHGINRIKNGSRITWKDFMKNGPSLIRDEVRKVVDYYNKAAVKLKLGCHFDADAIQQEGDMVLISKPGFEKWLRTQKVVATPVSAEQALRVVQYHQEKLYGSSWNKSFINCLKGCKAGKTKDIQQSSLMLCSYHFAKNGSMTRPLFVLTARQDGEAQLREQWEMLRDFFYYIRIVGDDSSWVVPELPLSFTINQIRLDRDLVRRAGGKVNPAKFDAAVEDALQNDIHLVICMDEADEGMKEGQIQTRWLRDKVVPYLKDKSGKICQLNWTATGTAYEIVREFGVNLQLEADTNYLKLSEVPKMELRDFTRKLGLGVTKIGNTCHSQSHPYLNQCAYIKTWYADELDALPNKEEKENFIEDVLDDPDFQNCWNYYRDEYVPATLSEIFLRSMKLNIEKGYGEVGGGFPFRVMGMRYLVNNDQSMRIVRQMRKLVPLDKGIIIPYFEGKSEKDSFCGHTVNWKKEFVQPEQAIHKAFEWAGLDYMSVPVLLMITNTARRTTEMPDNYIHFDLTRRASNAASLIQNGGRTCGFASGEEFRHNSLWICCPDNLAAYEDMINGRSKIQVHPSVLGGKTEEKDRIWLKLERRRHASKHPEIMEIFRRVDTEFLNRAWMLEKLQGKPEVSPRGGRTGFEISYNRGEPQTPINDIFVKEVFDFLASRHDVIFTDEHGTALFNETPNFATMTEDDLFIKDVNKYDMLKGQEPVLLNEKNEPDNFCMKACFEKGKIYAFAGIRLAREMSGFMQDRHMDNITINGNNRGNVQIQIEFDYDRDTGRMYAREIHLRLRTPVTERTFQEGAAKPGHMNDLLAGDKDKERWLKESHLYRTAVKKRELATAQ